jgi:hypothetical protein
MVCVKTIGWKLMSWSYLLSFSLSVVTFILPSEVAGQTAEGWRKDIAKLKKELKELNK